MRRPRFYEAVITDPGCSPEYQRRPILVQGNSKEQAERRLHRFVDEYSNGRATYTLGDASECEDVLLAYEVPERLELK